MKANELMLGDWVSLFQGNCDGSPCNCKITSISDNEIGIEGCDEYDSALSVLLFPIPLTPEILEKNGFTHSFGDSDFYDYEKWEKKVDDKTIQVIKDHAGWFCRVDDKKLTRSMGISPAVHTMQNIIRIGGIENEIEL